MAKITKGIMRNSIVKSILAISLTLLSLQGFAQASAVKVLNITNPHHSNAIQIGDVLNRTIEVEVSSAYHLPKTSLPLKGDSKDGIELRDIAVQSTQHGDTTTYHIALSYQVFASAAKPMVMRLPNVHFTLAGGTTSAAIEMPAWQFWYSPLVAEGITNAKENMQPQSKPPLFDVSTHYSWLWLALSVLATGLIGLIYVNADKSWLPFMNGAFAQAYRRIKKLGHSQGSHQHALMYMHQAFNQLYGENLFVHELDKFLAAHPKFLKMRADIDAFFTQSNAALFGNHASNGQELQQLKALSKRFRDCERGI